MMKKIIQISSVVFLAAVFFVVSAHAQVQSRITTSVPFKFQVGGKIYKPGDYVVKINTDSSNAINFTLLDSKGNTLQTLQVSDTGEAASGDARLVFSLRENQQYLSKIITKDKTFAISPTS